MDELEKNHRKKLVSIYRVLESYALHLTQDRERANDLLQETSLKIMNNYQKYKEEGSFTPWAKTVMKNMFVNDMKNSNKNCERFVDGYEYYRDEQKHPFVAESEAPYTIGEIRKAMEMLPHAQYIVLKLRENGYKYDEIAKELNTSIGNVKSRIFAAKVNLRNIMKNLR